MLLSVALCEETIEVSVDNAQQPVVPHARRYGWTENEKKMYERVNDLKMDAVLLLFVA